MITFFETFAFVIVANATFITCCGYIPVVCGRLLFKLVPTIYSLPTDAMLQNVALLGTGYAILFLVSLVWITCASLYAKLTNSQPDAYTRVVVRLLSYLYTFLKVAVMINVNFIVGPVFCGLVINIGTAEFFDKTVQQRFEGIKDDVISAFFMYDCIFSIYMGTDIGFWEWHSYSNYPH